MGRRLILLTIAMLLPVISTCDWPVHAASCTPLAQGSCRACKNCKYCRHCAQNGGKCSVCR